MARKLNKNGAAQPRKRKAKSDTPPAPTPNVTDATVQDFYGKALAAKLDLEGATTTMQAANDIYRAVLKDAKKAGIDPAVITWRLAQRNRSPEEIDAETRARNRIARLTNLPIGGQLGLWDDGQSVASKIEKDADGGDGFAEAPEPTAYHLGHDAGAEGKSVKLNPYSVGVKARAAWDQGWNDAVEETATGREPKGYRPEEAAAAN